MNRLLFLLPVLFLACGTQPKAANEALQAAEEKPAEQPAKYELAEAGPAEEQTPAAADTQNSGGLRQEAYDQIFNDVKVFIENLNMVIQSKNYNKWRESLSEERFNEISSPVFLETVSRTDSMRRRGIVLKTVHDYFLHVVVPSRANSQVDKIEIMDNNRVKAFYMYTKKTGDKNEDTETIPLLVYELAKTGDSWTIIR
ncbi:MAG: hypothetical protein LBU85_10545 [Treponema sp.]|jgi:hypothetical protein|nr:hypothetical protein [Treponema sp.]